MPSLPGQKPVKQVHFDPLLDTCVYEICCSPNSMLGKVSTEYNIPHIRFHKGEFDILNRQDVEDLKEQVAGVKRPITFISLPCTDWTQWQQVNCHQYGPEFRKALARRRIKSKRMLKNALEVGDQSLEQGGEFVFEWPRNASGWKLDILLEFIKKHNLFIVDFEGCAVGLTDPDGVPHLKRWRFITNNIRLANAFKNARCQHDAEFKHSPIAGNKTEKTGYYPRKMCQMIINALFPAQTASHVPAMPCCSIKHQEQHREREDTSESIFNNKVRSLLMQIIENEKVPAMVTRLLDRKEMLSKPAALQAVRKEASGLEAGGTWLPETVRELHELKQSAKTSGEKVVIGQLMTLCSEKYAELEDESQKVLKGRIVFRGDNARDESGALAIYQDLAATPTLITSANANIAYGLFPGNKTTSADAVKAYIQSTLKSEHPTWVELPRELWPTNWNNKYKRPVVRLNKSLYGHPESGAHWQNHLEDILKREMHAQPLDGHQSSYFFPQQKLLLTVYVDDFLLSGPEKEHAPFWEKLSKHVKLEEITGLGRFLGRYHEIHEIKGNRTFVFSMPDYVKSTCDLYLSLPGSKPLKTVPTPFVNEGSLVPADDEERGELSDNASKVLMKALWVARLARPDLLKPITALARHVQSWTRNCDKQLYRLICYMHSTPNLKLSGYINDPLDKVELRLYVDADFAGSREDTKSTSGGFLCIAGPNTFFPLSWVSKKQTSTSKSTAESELVSLSQSLFEEGIPMLNFWQTVSGRELKLKIKEDNEATIKIGK